MDVDASIHKVIAPHLQLMREEVREGWPTLDPELALLHWLCERNKVKVPIAQFLPNVPRGSRSLPEKWCRGGDSSGSTATPGPLPPLSSRPATSSGGPEKESFRTMPVLHSLQQIESDTAKDAYQGRGRLEALRNNGEKMRGVITNMRQELRGKFVSRVPLLSVLSQEEHLAVVGKLRPRSCSANDLIVQEGQFGDQLFIVERGVCEASSPSLPSCALHREDFFGELAVLYRHRYMATVLAKTSVTLLTLSRDDLLSSIREGTIERLLTATRVRLFASIPLLRTLTAQQKLTVARRLRYDVWPAGSTFARQGAHVTSDNRRLWIIEEGSCQKEVKGPSPHTSLVTDMLQSLTEAVAAPPHAEWPKHELELKEAECLEVQRVTEGRAGRNSKESGEKGRFSSDKLLSGQYFGMLSMFYGSPQSCTVWAETEVKSLSISHEELMDIFHDGDEGGRMKSAVQKSMRCHLIQQIEQLQDKDDEAILMVEAHTKEVAYKRWDVVFHQRDKLDTIFILAEGSLVEYAGDIPVMQDGDLQVGRAAPLRLPEEALDRNLPGTHFGSHCLTEALAAQSTSLVASTNCIMLRIPGFVVRQVLKKRGLERKTSIRTSKIL